MTLLPIVTLLLTMLSTPMFGGASEQVVKDAVKERATAYYGALCRGDYAEIWKFSSASMRRDNDPKEFASLLSEAVSEVSRKSEPQVILSTTGKDHRPMGKVTTELKVTTKGGQVVNLLHTTVWILDHPQAEPAGWYVVRDGMKDAKPNIVSVGDVK